MTPISAIASLPLADPGREPGAGRAARQTAPAPEAPQSDASPPERGFWDRLWGKEGFSFGAVLDIINPLQHIPIVSTIYRAATGDTIGPGPRMIGGTIFGGVVGLFAAAADAAVEGITGKDTGSHVMAMLPEPDPVSQWAYNDDLPRNRGLRMALLNQLDGSTSQLAARGATDKPGGEDIAAGTSAASDPTAAPELAAASIAATRVSDPASEQRSGPLFTPPPRTAQLGAGGRLVPLSTNGRPGSNLPTPQELAANPALLQEMRQGGASAVKAAQSNTGRIDTAIKGHGLVAPSPTWLSRQNQPAGATLWLDRMARESQAIPAAGESTASNGATPREAPSMPQVGPDFLMKMQQALDKYQAMRPAPTIDLSH